MRLSLTVLAGLILVCAANAKDADICLSPRDVDHTRVLSDNEILYVMKSGKNWKNTLRKSCPGFGFERAFSETIDADGICSNRQMITVINRGTPCFLDTFTPYTPPPGPKIAVGGTRRMLLEASSPGLKPATIELTAV